MKILRWLIIAIVILLTLPAEAAETSCGVPTNIGDGWEVARLSQSGFDSKRLCDILNNIAGREQNLHGLVIARHGRLVAELYRSGSDELPYHLFSTHRDFDATTLHDMRSVGKSVVGLLVGIASQQGKIGDPSTPVLSYYPELVNLVTPEHKAITLAHLLTMSSGLEWHEDGSFPDDENRLLWKWSPYDYVLSRSVTAQPGEEFHYNSGGTAVLANIIERTTGTSFNDFARINLFEPLGITDWEWTKDFHGRTRVYDGLRMRPRDLAKIGSMMVNHGKWHDRQIVPENWIAASLQPWIATGFDDTGYGYQWWTGSTEWHGRKLAWSAAFGRGSQRLFVIPELDMTVVVTAGTYDEELQIAAERINALFKEIISTVRE